MISALIPYRPGERHHDANWAWTKARWEALLPSVELVVEGDDGGASSAEFNHPLALNRAAARASGDLFVMADIDIIPDPEWLARAVRMVGDGDPWVVAEEYHKLDKRSTRRVLRSNPAGPVPDVTLDAPVEFFSCAPPLVISREGFEVAGGYDERIGWWGADDAIFRICADALWGLMGRCPGAALHLWHPPADPVHVRQTVQHQLVRRYEKAANNPDAVGEVRYG